MLNFRLSFQSGFGKPLMAGLLMGGLFVLSSTAAFSRPTVSGQAQSPIQTQSSARRPSFKILFKPPIGPFRPARTTGAGSRNGNLCSQDVAMGSLQTTQAPRTTLTALVPSSQFGLTAMERPTFWVYVPQTTAKQILLSLETEDGVFHSQTAFPAPSQAGMVSLPLPKTAPPLKTGTVYRWAALLTCGDRPHPNDQGVEAWVYRVAPTRPLALNSLWEKAAWDAEQGIWYDLLTELGAGRSQPNLSDAGEVLTDVLSAQGLGAVTSTPISTNDPG